MKTETITLETLKEEILKELRGWKKPMTFWDLLLAFSRNSYPVNKYVEERCQHEHLPLLGGGYTDEQCYTVRYKLEDVEMVLKAVDMLIKEGKCQIAGLPHLIVASFDGTHTYCYEFAVEIAEGPPSLSHRWG